METTVNKKSKVYFRRGVAYYFDYSDGRYIQKQKQPNVCNGRFDVHVLVDKWDNIELYVVDKKSKKKPIKTIQPFNDGGRVKFLVAGSRIFLQFDGYKKGRSGWLMLNSQGQFCNKSPYSEHVNMKKCVKSIEVYNFGYNPEYCDWENISGDIVALLN